MPTVVKIALWLIIASLVVLVIMNPTGFAAAVSTIGTQTNNIMTTLTGSNYRRAS